MRLPLLIGLAAVLVLGCWRSETQGPPPVRYGQDECIHCGMIITDERHAAALRAVVDGQTRDLLFDDIGDMIDYERDNPSVKSVVRYVHDFQTRQWIDVAQAKFVRDEKVHTPMGSGILAFADETKARAHGAQILAWTALQSQAKPTTACCTGENH